MTGTYTLKIFDNCIENLVNSLLLTAIFNAVIEYFKRSSAQPELTEAPLSASKAAS